MFFLGQSLGTIFVRFLSSRERLDVFSIPVFWMVKVINPRHETVRCKLIFPSYFTVKYNGETPFSKRVESLGERWLRPSHWVSSCWESLFLHSGGSLWVHKFWVTDRPCESKPTEHCMVHTGPFLESNWYWPCTYLISLFCCLRFIFRKMTIFLIHDGKGYENTSPKGIPSPHLSFWYL